MGTPLLVHVGPQGRIVIPAALRKAIGLKEGASLAVSADGRRLILEPREEVLRRLRDRFAALPPGTSLSAELLDDRREEAGREESS